jgi:predicted chitinase/uncharacterized protein (DUF2345 family)|tara:strand:+ start:8517 stop:11120 length:2604 start_codon:yes stop_codon:yes gene_type:complete
MAIEDIRRSRPQSVNKTGPFEAIIVNNLDPKYMGTLQVELLKSTGSGNQQNRSGQVIEASYLSPFYGVTPVASASKNEGYRHTQQSYGFWAIPPDIGTKVLVIFVEGNTSKCFWIGCVQDEFMNFMVPGLAATSMLKDFNKKAPAAEYNKLTTTEPSNDPTTHRKSTHLDLLKNYITAGLSDDETRGLTSSSARREMPSAVFGWSTPGPLDKREGAPKSQQGYEGNKFNHPKSRLGGSSFVMDDGDDKFLRKGHPKDTAMEYANIEAQEEGGDVTRPHNELARWRTRTGHQILMHNTEDLIYIANSRGTAWIEMSSNGKVDIYGADSISVHSQEDLNFTADRDINLTAGQDVNVVANKIRTSSHDSTSVIAGTQYSLNAGKDVNVNSGEDLVMYANGNGMLIAVEKQNISAGAQLSLGSTGGIGIEGHNEVKITTDGDYHMKALGSSYTSTGAEIHQTSALKTVIQSGNVLDLKAVGNLRIRTDAAGGLVTGGALAIYSEGNSIDIQGTAPSNPGTPTEAVIPPAPFIVDPTPPEIALKSARVPQHEPWFEHEHYDPLKYTPDLTRAGVDPPETYPPSTPDTFNRTPGGVVVGGGNQPNAYNSSGAPEGNQRFDPIAGANIPPDPEPVKIEKQELSRLFASALFAQGFSEEQVYAAIATAETESGLKLSVENSYSGTSNERIRSIFSNARTVSDAELTEIKKDKATFFELVYGYTSKIGPGMGNTIAGDGGKFIGRGLIQLTGKANYQRYGKLAGLTNAPITDYNPFGVDILDDPTILITDVTKSVAVTAAYLKERYKDFGRGTLGNFRFAIAGTERGYELGRPKDTGYLQAKLLPNGKYDPDWIRDPNNRNVVAGIDQNDPRNGVA